MKTIVYVDAFNLYYGALKNSPYKWLNLAKYCSIEFSKNDIKAIKVFAARVSARPKDPGQPIRQETYFRALQTIPTVQLIFGHFLSNVKKMPDADKPSVFHRVISTEEKGSDVNLAVHLLHDAHLNAFDVGIVISNDSDLAGAIEIVTKNIGKKVIVVNPHPANRASITLKKCATFVRQMRPGKLAASQFTKELKDDKGVFYKPASW